MTDITRRDFLKIAFGTVATAAFSGPLAAAWPKEARSRPVAEPWQIDIKGGYLDDEWVGDDRPTYRDFRDYDGLAIDERVERLLGLAGHDEDCLCERACLLEQLPVEECGRLGLWLVEGECPGNDFCGVRFKGNVGELNEALARHGINAIVQVAA